LERYASELQHRNSKLMLVGVSPVVRDQLVKTEITEILHQSQ
jgi:anti-anti-sigma regulatory factor